jgi:hypothetical protein
MPTISPVKHAHLTDSLLAVRNARKRLDKEANMLYNKDRDAGIFLQRITKLSPEDFIALAKILDVKMSIVDKDSGEYTLRDAEEILNDMIATFRKYKHAERQAVLKAMKKAITNGTRS